MANFSKKLTVLLSGKQELTIGMLLDAFGEKSYALIFLLLMALPALPLPTGGVTHIFELVVMLLSLELIAGRSTMWLPKRWLKLNLPSSLRSTALPRFTKFIAWVEKYSKPRLRQALSNSWSVRVIGLVVLLFSIFSFIAPPFTGLDTLPALGVVLISLGVLLEDYFLAVAGTFFGFMGVSLILILGRLTFKFL